LPVTIVTGDRAAPGVEIAGKNALSWWRPAGPPLAMSPVRAAGDTGETLPRQRLLGEGTAMNTITRTILVATASTSMLLASSAEASTQPIHPDCADHAHPTRCTEILTALEVEVDEMVLAFQGHDLDAMASYVSSPGAITKYGDTFYRGWDAYRHDALEPVYTQLVDHINFDTSGLRFQVVSDDLVMQYGDYSAELVLKNGSVVMDYRRTLIVWTKNPGDPSRPFRIAGELDETL
jgi:hypothetical protein